MIADPDELAAEIRQSQETGQVSARLVWLLHRVVAYAWWLTVRKDSKRLSWEDIRQDCLVRVLELLPLVDTSNNPFAFLLRTCVNVILMTRRTERNRLKRFDNVYKRYKTWQI